MRYLPNTFTALNLIAGFLGILAVFNGDLYWGASLILIGSVFDFLDGFAARMLKAISETGKQLDSLADLVTFGVLPALLVYAIFVQSDAPVLKYMPLLIVVSSAFRLAKFNVDESQKVYFKGLPTPASAFLVVGLVYAREAEWQTFSYIYDNLIGLTIYTVIISLLLNAPLAFLSFKFTRLKIRGNEYMLLIALVSVLSLAFFRLKGIMPATLFYVLLSLFRNVIPEKRVS